MRGFTSWLRAARPTWISGPNHWEGRIPAPDRSGANCPRRGMHCEGSVSTRGLARLRLSPRCGESKSRSGVRRSEKIRNTRPRGPTFSTSIPASAILIIRRQCLVPRLLFLPNADGVQNAPVFYSPIATGHGKSQPAAALSQSVLSGRRLTSIKLVGKQSDFAFSFHLRIETMGRETRSVRTLDSAMSNACLSCQLIAVLVCLSC